MMMTPSSRDVERLSAYMDGQCSASDKEYVESRLQTDQDYARLMSELLHNLTLLRGMPKHRMPRNFTLKPSMAGLRPPLPRAVPVLSWASVTAMVVFVFSFGANYLGTFFGGASAPMMAAAPADNARGAGGGPVSTLPPASETLNGTPTPEVMLMTGIQATPEPIVSAPSVAASTKAAAAPVSPWFIILPVLALMLISTSLLLRWNTVRIFKRKYKS
jgi:anti-sigma factor RsiW